MAKQKYYVVWQGQQTGVYEDWETCRRQVQGVAGAKYKSFPTRAEAEQAFKLGAQASASDKQKNKTTKTDKPARANTVKTWAPDEVAKLTTDTQIFTDGGCEPNPGEAGSGIAVYRKGVVDELWYGLYNPDGTNNTAELNALYQAMVLAAEELKAKRSVSILCDSKYSIQCVTQWAVKWEQNGWTRPTGEIKNLDLIKSLYAEYQTLKDKVDILHVNGHVGVEGNELADRMSILAIDEKSPDFNRYADKINIDEILALRSG